VTPGMPLTGGIAGAIAQPWSTPMKYRVLLQQYVEQVASMEIEADTPEDAKDEALLRGAEADWGPGDDAMDVECYAVMDGADMVWER